MKVVTVALFIMQIAFNPASGEYKDCGIFRIDGKLVTLWDIQKVVVLELVFRNEYPDPATVENFIKKNRDRIIQFFMLREEVEKIMYENMDRNSFIQAVLLKISKRGSKFLHFLKSYSLSVTDAAEYLYSVSRIKSYLDNFLYRDIEVSDQEIREYYNRNKDKFLNESFHEAEDSIKEFLLLKKKRKALREHISNLIRTEFLEVLKPDLSCKGGD